MAADIKLPRLEVPAKPKFMSLNQDAKFGVLYDLTLHLATESVRDHRLRRWSLAGIWAVVGSILPLTLTVLF